MGDASSDEAQQEPLQGLLQLPAVVLCQLLASMDLDSRRALFSTCHAARRIVLANCNSVRLHPRKGARQRMLAQLLEVGPGQTCLELRLSMTSIRWEDNFLPKIGLMPMLRNQQLQALSIRNGTTLYGAWAVSLATALRRLKRLELCELWFQGDHFFKTLVSVATQLTSLKVDNVMLLDPQADHALGLVGTQLPLLQELELCEFDADVCAALPALMGRVTRLRTSSRQGARSWMKVVQQHTQLLTNLRSLALRGKVCITWEVLTALNACPHIESVEAYELDVPGNKYHVVYVSDSDEEEQEEEQEDYHNAQAEGKGGEGGKHVVPVGTSMGLPPTLRVLTLERTTTAALARFPGLAKVPELRVSFLDLPMWDYLPQEEEAFTELTSAVAVLAAAPRVTGTSPDSRLPRKRGPVLEWIPKDDRARLLPRVVECMAPMAHHLSALGLHGVTLDPKVLPGALKDLVGTRCYSLCLSHCKVKDHHAAATWAALLGSLPQLTTLQIIQRSWSQADNPRLVELVSAADAAQRSLTLQLSGGVLGSDKWVRKLGRQSPWVTVMKD